LPFLLAGKVAVAAISQGGLMVRADPALADRLRATANARSIEMKGRAVQGWLHVKGDDLYTERQLAQWIAVGTATVTRAPVERSNR
jgi:hypothetical protein